MVVVSGETNERRVPIGFAHRGARAERPENTLAAFSRALELGATGLESDAWITSDGVAVLDHDGVVGRWWHRRRIGEVDRAGLPPHVPSLEDLYAVCGSRFELSLDVKDGSALGAILRSARAAVASTRLWLCHPDHRLLAGWREVAPETRLVHSTRMSGPRRAPGNRFAQSYLDAVRGSRIDAVNMRGPEWNAELVDAVHAVGLLALAWDAQSSGDIRRLLDAGVDGLFSDHPELAMSAIREQFGPGRDPAGGAEESPDPGPSHPELRHPELRRPEFRRPEFRRPELRRSERPDPAERPDDQERPPDDEALSDGPDDP
jgi:glycerophosphoryl diester phosphodiesterase